jgi:hypothetical protein
VSNNRARFQVADAQGVPFDEASIDAVVGGLVLNLVPEPAREAHDLDEGHRFPLCR